MSCEVRRQAQSSHSTDREKIPQAETKPPMTCLLENPAKQIMLGKEKKRLEKGSKEGRIERRGKEGRERERRGR